MPFNKEIEDFAQAFSSGYSMVESRSEQEAREADTAYKKQRTAAEAYTTDPAYQQNLKEKLVQDVRLGKATADEAEWKNSPEMRRLSIDDQKSIIKYRDTQQRLDEAKAKFNEDPQNVESQKRLLSAQADNEAAAAEVNHATAGEIGARTEGQQIKNKSDRLKLTFDENMARITGDGSPPGAVPLDNQPRTITGFTPPASADGTTAPESAVPTGPGIDASGTNVGAGPIDPRSAVVRSSAPPANAVDAGPVYIDPITGVPSGSYADPAPAAPATGPAGPAPAASAAEEPESTIGTHDDPIEDGHAAVRAGLTASAQINGLDQDQAVDTPDSEDRHRAYLTGANAADAGTAKLAEDTVNEMAGGGLSQNEKVFYALSYGYRYYTNKGDPETATKYALALTDHYKMVVGQYAAVINAAASRGDMDAVAAAAVRAYANIPTGDELSISKTQNGHYLLTYKNMKGELTQQQLATPEEMGAMAMHVDSSSFVPLIAAAVGRDKNIMSEAAQQAMPEIPPGLTPAEGNLWARLHGKIAGAGGTGTGAGVGKKPVAPASDLTMTAIDSLGIDDASQKIVTAFDAYREKRKDKVANVVDPAETGKEEEFPAFMESFRPLATNILLTNRSSGLDAEATVRAGVSFLSGTKPHKMREIDAKTFGIVMPGTAELNIDKDVYDQLVIMREDIAGRRREKDAADRAEERAKKKYAQDVKDAQKGAKTSSELIDKRAGIGLGAVDTSGSNYNYDRTDETEGLRRARIANRGGVYDPSLDRVMFPTTKKVPPLPKGRRIEEPINMGRVR
jgi:hypothetical protein